MSISAIPKCENCEHSLFIRLCHGDQKWYCDMHHPDKVRMIMDRRKKEDMLMNLPPIESVISSYKKIIEDKDKEIQLLRHTLRTH